jgi:hypothetical protein
VVGVGSHAKPPGARSIEASAGRQAWHRRAHAARVAEAKRLGREEQARPTGWAGRSSKHRVCGAEHHSSRATAPGPQVIVPKARPACVVAVSRPARLRTSAWPRREAVTRERNGMVHKERGTGRSTRCLLGDTRSTL